MIVAPKVEGEIEIGKFYNVPTVHGLFMGKRANWPVLGPKHEDAEYIKFPQHHYHFDWRFVDDQLFNMITERGDYHAYAWVLHDHERPNLAPVKCGPVVYRRRKCRRDFPAYPRGRAPWMHELTEAYSDHVLDDRLICPHRGASLASLLPDQDGCVVCPLHGLKWNLATRRIVEP